jgi:hypothetical protein
MFTALVIVKTETVIAWDRRGFRLFWILKVQRGQAGRPALPGTALANLAELPRESRPDHGIHRLLHHADDPSQDPVTSKDSTAG